MDITIRHAEKSDFEAITAIYAQPHAYGGTLQLPYPPESLWQQRLEQQPEGLYNLVALVDERVVGQLGLMTNARPRRKHVADFGMGVCRSVEGQGVGSALMNAMIDLCDNWLNILRIELDVYTDNERAIALYKKHGFVTEGEHPCSGFRDGRYVDVYTMARLRPEAKEKQANP